jgi:hypothetical protein
MSGVRVDDAQDLAGPLDTASARQLTRDRLAASDREHPIDRGSVRRVAVVGEPATDRSAGDRRIGSGDSPCIGGIDGVGEPIEQVGVVSQQGGGTGEDRCDVTTGDLGREGQQFVTDPTPPELALVVRGVSDRIDPELGADRLGVGPSECEQRVPMTGRHRREAVGPAATKEAEHQRLGLVVERVAGHRRIGQRQLPGGAGTSFEVRTGRDIDAMQLEGDADPGRDPACLLGVIPGLRADAVVDVVSCDVEAGAVGQRDEGGRVGSPREGARHGTWRFWEGAAGEQLVEDAQSSCSRPRLPCG